MTTFDFKDGKSAAAVDYEKGIAASQTHPELGDNIGAFEWD